MAACTMLGAGCLLILLSADWRDTAISPGPLSRPHAQLLAGNWSNPQCAACHEAAGESAASWTMSLAIGHQDQADQTQRCMECHERTISAEYARTAHNLPAEALRQVATGLEDNEDAAPSRRVPASLACATCHAEHQGAEFDLTAMSDAACQACHRQRYDSFNGDHPDFGPWPYERRTRIAFNHASHRAKHFAERKQTFDCRSCHLDDATGNVQLLASYEAACASCHDEKIAASLAQGVPMLMLPSLDVEALKSAGHDIGPWPEEASGDFDGRLPPMMKLLLASDPEASRAMATLGEDFEFLDVDPDEEEHLAAAANLATAIKRLFAEMAESATETVRERLRASVDSGLTTGAASLLIAGMPVDLVGDALRQWGIDHSAPHDERNAQPRENQAKRAKNQAKLAVGIAGSWSRDDAHFSIDYSATAHADPVLASWLELVASAPQLTEKPIALAMLKELTQPAAAGLCASCHSVEQGGDGRVTINWRAYDRASARRGMTKFSHAPHLALPGLTDCAECHTIVDTPPPSPAYSSWNLRDGHSDFVPLAKRQCAECHTANAAGNACQQCHRYHAETIESWRMATDGGSSPAR